VLPRSAPSSHALRLAGLALLALLALADACTDATAPSAPGGGGGGTPVTQSFNHPGFDIGVYPGDATMSAWAHGGSPYEWVGYYLPAPCHRDATWSGTRARLAALGWGFTVIYVGQQTWDGVADRIAASTDLLAPSATRITEGAAATGPTCSRTLLSASQGDAEGADAIAKTASEGFADGTVIFLDLEPMDSVSTVMQSYYRAWIGRVLADGRFRPGIYAHRKNAAQIYADARDVYTQHGLSGAPEFWITGGAGFSLASSPEDTGFQFASMWQGAYDVARSYHGASATIDESVSRNPSPSFPAIPTSP
jgi:hypothetical protein